MFLRSKIRRKDGKEHRYWSLVENRRVRGNRVVQRQVLYLGEINDTQRASWSRTIEAFADGQGQGQQLALFPEGRSRPVPAGEAVEVRLDELAVRRPRQWGGCWLACELWDQLGLDEFWSERLAPSRKGTRWLNVFKTLAVYRLLDPGSEWRLHRQWFDQSAIGDLLGEDFGVVQIDKLYRCLDRLLVHKEDFFGALKERWQSLFGVTFEVLLYDLTSTYFESDPPAAGGKRRYGYSRDKRPDCLQVVIALIVTPEGFPLAYEVMPGNTADNTTLPAFLDRIEACYGKAKRTWVMDRGIPTEETLERMRRGESPIHYLVGTPKGRLSRLEADFLSLPWEQVRQRVRVKLLAQDDELYILARSDERVNKERGMRRRRLKKLWRRLGELRQQRISRDQLLLKIGAAKKEAGRVYGLVHIQLPKQDQAVTPETYTFALRKDRLRQQRRREGQYLLRTNLRGEDPAELWRTYIQLTEIEQAFKELKGDLAIRPIHHQLDQRIEAHIFVAFVAYCLQVTLKNRLRALAPGLTPRAVLEKLSAIQMVDVHLPTTDGRQIVLSRYTQPEKDQQLLLQQLKLTLPPQPPPRITSEIARSA
ncbi:MAG: IS1634 family transposase [Alphaproteobacteria bacterium]|jgi:transposase|nr:IS1634 family transposase [Rhodospirillaceae bacterium]MDP6406819.1 IS1634 family transposase [Alphaproteobacteria bacterium]|tara:strand:+ start:164 stop:1939 length:1776 start_codon:yes stop_codon:yes gene_type:complete